LDFLTFKLQGDPRGYVGMKPTVYWLVKETPVGSDATSFDDILDGVGRTGDHDCTGFHGDIDLKFDYTLEPIFIGHVNQGDVTCMTTATNYTVYLAIRVLQSHQINFVPPEIFKYTFMTPDFVLSVNSAAMRVHINGNTDLEITPSLPVGKTTLLEVQSLTENTGNFTLESSYTLPATDEGSLPQPLTISVGSQETVGTGSFQLLASAAGVPLGNYEGVSTETINVEFYADPPSALSVLSCQQKNDADLVFDGVTDTLLQPMEGFATVVPGKVFSCSIQASNAFGETIGQESDFAVTTDDVAAVPGALTAASKEEGKPVNHTFSFDITAPTIADYYEGDFFHVQAKVGGTHIVGSPFLVAVGGCKKYENGAPYDQSDVLGQEAMEASFGAAPKCFYKYGPNYLYSKVYRTTLANGKMSFDHYCCLKIDGTRESIFNW